MTFAIAAAGTGGHVYPGLAVGEALATRGVSRSDIVFVGGSRLEQQVYPSAGFPFLSVELRGLQRRITPENLRIPAVVWRAVGAMCEEFRHRRVRVVLGMGGYVTVPAALAARRARLPLAVSEQNAHAGLANRMASRIAQRAFGSFPSTVGLPSAEWVGNPVRQSLADFDRSALRPGALARYGLRADIPVLGVFGGSLGAGIINAAVADLVGSWNGPDVQVLHLTGRAHAGAIRRQAAASRLSWLVVGYEEDMAGFYAAADLVIARAGGAVAELTATRSASLLIPGGFGSSGHQHANAAVLQTAGAAVVVAEDRIDRLPSMAAALLGDPARLEAMRAACGSLAKPGAAAAIAQALEELHG